MITKEQILEQLKTSRFDSQGSGIGNIYHEIPFEEFRAFSSRRTSNENRLKLLLDHYDFQDKTVLDIGCNIGYFSFKLAEQGAVCYGLDHDPEAIQIANMLKSYRSINNVHFFHGQFEEEMLEHLLSKAAKFDVILIFSVIHWLLYQHHDIDRVISLLRKVQRHNQVIFYEPSTSKRAFYPEQTKTKNIFYFLKNIGCKTAQVLGKSRAENAGADRIIWMGVIDYPAIAKEVYSFLSGSYKSKNPKLQILTHRRKGACVIFDQFFVKVRLLNHPMIFTSENEIRFSILLNGKSFVPHYFCHLDYNEYRFIFYANPGLPSLDTWTRKTFLTKSPSPSVLEKKLFNILAELKRDKIVHRDIFPSNILVDKRVDNLYLVDWELATFDGQELQTSTAEERATLESCLKKGNGGYRLPDMNFSFETDAYAARRIVKRLKTMTFPNILVTGVLVAILERLREHIPSTFIQRCRGTFFGTLARYIKNAYF